MPPSASLGREKALGSPIWRRLRHLGSDEYRQLAVSAPINAPKWVRFSGLWWAETGGLDRAPDCHPAGARRFRRSRDGCRQLRVKQLRRQQLQQVFGPVIWL